MKRDSVEWWQSYFENEKHDFLRAAGKSHEQIIEHYKEERNGYIEAQSAWDNHKERETIGNIINALGNVIAKG